VRLAGADAWASGTHIWFGDSSLTFDITTACLGGLLFWVYAALVMAESGITRKQRVIGLVVGLVALLAFNLFRIAISVYLEWRTGANVHNYFYFFNMVFVLLIWAGWVRTLRQRPAKVAQPGM
jgi:exosortase/archaeosortase family protein